MLKLNLIIVDDEEEIRTGLHYKLDWERLGYQIVGEAANGLEALELLENTEVHVMITDIRMPVMDGMALLNEQKQRFPQVRTIVLSGYDDFAYAKTALQCGARDYLLKPVGRKELSQLLALLYQEIKQERDTQSEREQLTWNYKKHSEMLQEHFVLELIAGQYTGDHDLKQRISEQELTFMFSEQTALRFICVQMKLTKERLAEGQGQIELLQSAFYMMCKELALKEEDHILAFRNWSDPGKMHFAVNYSEEDPQEQANLRLFLRSLDDNLRRYLRLATVIAVGRQVRGLDHIKEAYISSLLVWSGEDDSRSEVVWVDETTEQDEIGFGSELRQKLMIMLESSDVSGVQSMLDGLLQSRLYSIRSLSSFVGKVYFTYDETAQRNGVSFPIMREQFPNIPELLQEFQSLKQIVEHLVDMAERLTVLLTAAKSASGERTVEAIRQYIDQNYAADIGLSILAERFYINPSYLSELFKRHVGQTFSDYVLNVRITKAKQHLHDPSLRLADIAELVGFSSASYLSNVFKKVYGQSPNDYRQAIHPGKIE